MRLLFYGLQNSGATLLTLLAGQRPDSLVVPDLWSMYCAPELDTDLDACLKATITSSFPLSDHVEAFRPDHVFLVVRRPVDNFLSLRRKHYARHNGTPEQKFAIADECFAHPERFTDVLVFESMATDPGGFMNRLRDIGWEVPEDAATFPRTSLDMERHIWERVPDLYSTVQWGAGEARVEPLGTIRLRFSEDAEADDFARAHASHMHTFYERRGHPAEEVIRTLTPQDDIALQNRTNYVRSMLGIFEGLLREHRAAEALRLATELTELAPTFPDAWNARARALEHSGSIDLAAALWETAATHVGDDPALLAQISVARARQAARLGRSGEALEMTSALVVEHEGFVPAHLLHAELSLRAELVDAAREHSQRVLAEQPRNVSAALVLANVHALEGDVAKARGLLEACLAIQPDFEIGRRRLTELVNAADQEPSAADH